MPGVLQRRAAAVTVAACSSGGASSRRFTTSKAEAAKWRAIYARKSPGADAGKRTQPAAVLARLDATKGIIVSDAQEGKKAIVAFAGRKKEDYVLRFGDQVCVIGENGAGKSLFWQALSGKAHVLPPGMAGIKKEQEEELAQGMQSLEAEAEGGKGGMEGGGEDGERKRLMFMSFSMHGQFLAEHKDRVVADVLGGSSDPLARRLIVQLGLYPLWYKKIYMLSTGEIRKVLLAATLSQSPRVLVLDKPFDGLDAPSRKSLRIVLSQLCLGFPRLLVDLGLSRRSIPRTSMVLITHRGEEIPEETTRLVAVKDMEIEFEGPMQTHRSLAKQRLTHSSPSSPASSSSPSFRLPKLFRPQVPRASTLKNEKTRDNLSTILEFHNVHLQKNEHLLLDNIEWKVKQGNFWALKGLNGAGKSTLTKLILEAWEKQLQERRRLVAVELGQEQQQQQLEQQQHEGRVAVGVPRLGMVSTELHLHLAATCHDWPTSAVVLSGLDPFYSSFSMQQQQQQQQPYHPPPPHLLPLLEEWGHLLGLSSFYSKPFGELSQGQQKLAVIARALIGAPPLLIFDEACQGLDSQHRRLVLALLESIAQAASSWLTVLYVSHHEDEALTKVTTHVLELEKGRVAFVGSEEEWERVEEGRMKEREVRGVGGE